MTVKVLFMKESTEGFDKQIKGINEKTANGKPED